jgi:hypothetical protein
MKLKRNQSKSAKMLRPMLDQMSLKPKTPLLRALLKILQSHLKHLLRRPLRKPTSPKKQKSKKAGKLFLIGIESY